MTLRHLEVLRSQRDYSPRAVRSALREHGYLARALQLCYPHDPDRQIAALSQFLHTAYGNSSLGRRAITNVLSGTSNPPTPALLAAVLLNLANSEDANLAREAFISGLFDRSNLSGTTRARLAATFPPAR